MLILSIINASRCQYDMQGVDMICNAKSIEHIHFLYTDYWMDVF